MRWGGRCAAAAVLFAFVLGSCAQQPPPDPMLWIRTDGQRLRDNPVLEQEFELARTVCLGEVSKANLSGTQLCRGVVDCAVQGAQRDQGLLAVGKGCMAEKGYVMVPESEVAARQAEFRATQKLPINASPVPRAKKKE